MQKVFDMRLDISDIPEGGLQREYKIPVSVNEVSGPDIADVCIRVTKIKRIILVEGSVRINASLICSRCLKDFHHPLEISFKEEYKPAEDLENEDEKELAYSELDTGFYRNDEIDIAELVSEQVLLSVPMKPLCGTGCRGICPECGKDLNAGPCECRTDRTDPRLAPLKKIKELMKDRKE